MRRLLTGARAWVVQRLSALYLFGFFAFVAVRLSKSDAPWTYEAWSAWMGHTGIRVAIVLFFAALLLHTWVGMRDVILDYVRPLAARTFVLAALALSQIAIGAWVLVIVFPVY